MIFGPVPLEEASGGVLAHTLRLPGRTLRKGSILGEADVAALREEGLSEIVVARLEPGDVDENEAAARLARSAAGEHLEVRAAFTGRANLVARVAGVVRVDEERILAANGVNEAVTLSCLRPWTSVGPGDLVATAKIITLAVPGTTLDRACALLGGEAALDLSPFEPHRCGLVLTTLPGSRPELLERAEAVTRARLERLGSTLGVVRRCAHEEDAVVEALSGLLEEGPDLVLVLGASVAVDREDVVPRAMARIGARVERFGIPVDPGNLLIVARTDGATLLGVPGCARSSRRSGFDQVLERVLAGLHPDGADLTAMAVGGLLKEIGVRPQPREAERSHDAGTVAAVVLAAGRSRRMAGVNKLLEPVDEAPMVAQVVDRILESRARPVVVVTGHDRGAVDEALAGRPVTTVHNPDYQRGMSSSLRRGLQALASGEADDHIRGALICLGDMPAVKPGTLDALMDAFGEYHGEVACVPVHQGKRGNPVLWGAAFFSAMEAIQGDVGARGLLAQDPESVVEVPVDDPGVLLDVDTREALLRLRGEDRPPPP